MGIPGLFTQLNQIPPSKEIQLVPNILPKYESAERPILVIDGDNFQYVLPPLISQKFYRSQHYDEFFDKLLIFFDSIISSGFRIAIFFDGPAMISTKEDVRNHRFMMTAARTRPVLQSSLDPFANVSPQSKKKQTHSFLNNVYPIFIGALTLLQEKYIGHPGRGQWDSLLCTFQSLGENDHHAALFSRKVKAFGLISNDSDATIFDLHPDTCFIPCSSVMINNGDEFPDKTMTVTCKGYLTKDIAQELLGIPQSKFLLTIPAIHGNDHTDTSHSSSNHTFSKTLKTIRDLLKWYCLYSRFLDILSIKMGQKPYVNPLTSTAEYFYHCLVLAPDAWDRFVRFLDWFSQVNEHRLKEGTFYRLIGAETRRTGPPSISKRQIAMLGRFSRYYNDILRFYHIFPTTLWEPISILGSFGVFSYRLCSLDVEDNVSSSAPSNIQPIQSLPIRVYSFNPINIEFINQNKDTTIDLSTPLDATRKNLFSSIFTLIHPIVENLIHSSVSMWKTSSVLSSLFFTNNRHFGGNIPIPIAPSGWPFTQPLDSFVCWEDLWKTVFLRFQIPGIYYLQSRVGCVLAPIDQLPGWEFPNRSLNFMFGRSPRDIESLKAHVSIGFHPKTENKTITEIENLPNLAYLISLDTIFHMISRNDCHRYHIVRLNIPQVMTTTVAFPILIPLNDDVSSSELFFDNQSVCTLQDKQKNKKYFNTLVHSKVLNKSVLQHHFFSLFGTRPFNIDSLWPDFLKGIAPNTFPKNLLPSFKAFFLITTCIILSNSKSCQSLFVPPCISRPGSSSTKKSSYCEKAMFHSYELDALLASWVLSVFHRAFVHTPMINLSYQEDPCPKPASIKTAKTSKVYDPPVVFSPQLIQAHPLFSQILDSIHGHIPPIGSKLKKNPKKPILRTPIDPRFIGLISTTRKQLSWVNQIDANFGHVIHQMVVPNQSETTSNFIPKVNNSPLLKNQNSPKVPPKYPFVFDPGMISTTEIISWPWIFPSQLFYHFYLYGAANQGKNSYYKGYSQILGDYAYRFFCIWKTFISNLLRQDCIRLSKLNLKYHKSMPHYPMTTEPFCTSAKNVYTVNDLIYNYSNPVKDLSSQTRVSDVLFDWDFSSRWARKLFIRQGLLINPHTHPLQFSRFQHLHNQYRKISAHPLDKKIDALWDPIEQSILKSKRDTTFVSNNVPQLWENKSLDTFSICFFSPFFASFLLDPLPKHSGEDPISTSGLQPLVTKDAYFNRWAYFASKKTSSVVQIENSLPLI